jgi:signal transduction histidine kinase
MIEPQAHKKAASVHFPPSPARVLSTADRTRVKQVLINLLSNAIKYNRIGGTVDRGVPGRTARIRLRISVATPVRD